MAQAKTSSAQPVQAVTLGAAPKPPGIFDELAKLEQAEGRIAGNEVHTLGQWARAKGVTLPKIREAIQAGRINVSDLQGDGQMMSEAEFDESVGFELKGTFGVLPVNRTHIPADVARGGAPEGETAEQRAEREDAEAKGRKV